MKTKEARELGTRIAALVEAWQVTEAHALLAPVLAERTPFAMLRHIGETVGTVSLEPANAFLECIAAGRTEGGWVVIASVLEGQLDRDLAGAFSRCHRYIVAADIWYGADILGEGVAGQALVRHFQPALDQLVPWRVNPNAWVRRAVGVSAHFWAKRSQGEPACRPQAETLLGLLEPMFDEWDMAAVKGVGWGLKTLGRTYPDLVAEWLAQQVIPGQRHHRALMLRKALTYLSDEQRAWATGADAPDLSPGEPKDSQAE